VLFAGPAGSGKTSLAVACLRASPWPGAFFVGAKDLERARIEQQAGRGEAPLVQRSLAARLLLVDDLGQDKPSAVSAVEAVLLARHDASRTTWVTTGLTARELEERYGAGIARRLTEKKTALVIRTSKEFKLT
jgi:DNA replication protein DnaC